ncbi:FCD domain-containing protein [Vreelandella titanicae]|jgi:GntR family transcriptional regulator, transcriptional repressor for pyruvate dehydrogenase complex|uniref:FadR/GntR family transcriptional regulator n=1 Tax=Halomonadaceae TaxID=28256 RepID=UPI0003490323|nr:MULTISPECIES: FCD domain-containing protein [Halomonas]KIN14227.1 GntR family transcriptional regulator [Halomonas sp. KHS3]NVE88617.1 FadR family transcriptional regulator [Halomonas titanicae]|tara:strand:+ start:296 stop:1150 length:855 start_codon:yes stop_codon:yes gene_type:complete
MTQSPVSKTVSTTGSAAKRRPKLAELISDDIKRWIAAESLGEGDRLPNEKALMELYGSAKATVREALKILEVEGLITLKTGPKGGAVINQPGMEPASRMLRNFLHFQQLDGKQVYQLRKLLEVELAASVVGKLTEHDFQQLEANMSACACCASDAEDHRHQRFLELEFHQLLARVCPNPLLAFMCQFLNDMLRDLVVIKKAYVPERKQFDHANQDYHRQLVEAYRAEDIQRVRQVMAEHMADAEHHMSALEAEMAAQMLISNDSPNIQNHRSKLHDLPTENLSV